MKSIYRANILFTKEKDRFDVLERGYVAVEDGYVTGVAADLKELDSNGAEIIDFGDKLLIPAMNDVHVHAPQYRNQGIAMDLELLPWLQNYTFPEESKYADTAYAERMYRRFIHDLWRFGTMRSTIFATIHLESTRLLMNLIKENGMGALVGKTVMNQNCPETLCETIEDAIANNEALIAEFNQPKALVRPIITPRFVPSCTSEMLKACGKLAQKHQKPIILHTKGQEGRICQLLQGCQVRQIFSDGHCGLYGTRHSGRVPVNAWHFRFEGILQHRGGRRKPGRGARQDEEIHQIFTFKP
jgi:guanine deaminase